MSRTVLRTAFLCCAPSSNLFRRRVASVAHYAVLVLLTSGLMCWTAQAHAQAYYNWYAEGFYNGVIYHDFNSFSAAEIAYFIDSFRGPSNASLTSLDPGTCGTAPTALGQICNFSTSYHVMSSGATPTEPDYMRSYGYGYWVSAVMPPQSQVSSCDSINAPINPATGGVYTTAEDVKFAGAGVLSYRRVYNIADISGFDGVPGWRHSYDRHINTVTQAVSATYPGQSSLVSAQYLTASDACTSGFVSIQASVSAWTGTTASFNNGVCILSSGSTVIGTLVIQSFALPAALSTTVVHPAERCH